MAVFQCKSCGATKEGRCKPQKCECGAKGEFVKVELTPAGPEQK
ncbi:MAG TPA: hypothetical protein VK464_29095 [Symbiobacteriaceae bacterium]|jgi:ABC-type ATPase with predicted acetyltransferase domain|nr:hypothetical protein [Symbiobacteriaceae bacterium]